MIHCRLEFIKGSAVSFNFRGIKTITEAFNRVREVPNFEHVEKLEMEIV